MSTSINNHNLKITILNIIIERENLKHISKFCLAASIIQYIDLHLILFDIYIDNLIIALDIEFNL